MTEPRPPSLPRWLGVPALRSRFAWRERRSILGNQLSHPAPLAQPTSGVHRSHIGDVAIGLPPTHWATLWGSVFASPFGKGGR